MRLVNYNTSGEYVNFYYRDKDGKRVIQTEKLEKKVYYVRDDNGTDGISEEGFNLKKVDFLPIGQTVYGAEVSDVDYTRLVKNITFYNPENIPLRYGIVDIETDDKDGFPNVKTADKQILCYVLYDNYEDKFYIHGLEEVSVDKLIDKIGGLNFKIFYHKTERDMITWLHKYFTKVQPDLISGWNIKNFDISYLQNRAKRLKIDFSINNAILFDSELAYIHIKPHEESYKLDDVSKIELGYGKIEREEVWKMSALDRYYYCFIDVKIVRELDKKIGMLVYHENLSFINNVHILQTFYPTTFVYMDILTKTINTPLKYRINFDEDENDDDEIEGGKVFEPSTGIFNDVFVVDISGSYPSMIRSHNISPEMIVYENGVPVGFRTDKKGVLPLTVEEVTKSRDEVKEKLKVETNEILRDGLDKFQYALKTVNNSYYGVFTSRKFKMYNKYIASEITRTARDMIISIKNYVEGLLYKVLYGDTDSIFVKAKTNDVKKEAFELVGKINAYIEDLRKSKGLVNYTKITVDIIYKSWLQTGAKKRYAGLYEEKGELKVKVRGYEVIRRGNSLYTKEVQKEFIKLLLTDVQKAKEFYDKQDKRWNDEKVPLTKIAISYGLRMNLDQYKTNIPAVKAIENSKRRGIKIDENLGRIWMYYLRNNELIAIVPDTEIPKNLKVDYKVHKEKCFTSPLENLYSLLGMQTSLNDFFE